MVPVKDCSSPGCTAEAPVRGCIGKLGSPCEVGQLGVLPCMAGLVLSFIFYCIVCCIVLHWHVSSGDQADLSPKLLAMRFYPSGAISQKLMADQPLHGSATKILHPVKNLLTRSKEWSTQSHCMDMQYLGWWTEGKVAWHLPWQLLWQKK